MIKNINRSPQTKNFQRIGSFLVGDTGLEPVTSTMSM